MGSGRAGWLLGALLAGAVLVVAVPSTLSWSDGAAGGTGQVPEHLRECADGFQYCKANLQMCGGCHGEAKDMRHEPASGLAVADRIAGSLVVNGNTSMWEYQPETSYVLDVGILLKNGYDDPSARADARPAGSGAYSDGAFALNASAGTLSVPAGDDSVRITGGRFEHHGSHRPDASYRCPNDPPGTADCRYGQATDDESAHAGEAVSTYAGSMQRQWSVTWTAPASSALHGVAFRLVVMVPNGDGLDNCVHEGCNSANGYSDPSEWDWWTHRIDGASSPSTPEAVILCEAGEYSSRDACRDAVLAAVEGRAPPPGSSGTTNTTSTPGGEEDPVVGGQEGQGGAGKPGSRGSDVAGGTGDSTGTQASQEPPLPIPTVGILVAGAILGAVALGRRGAR